MKIRIIDIREQTDAREEGWRIRKPNRSMRHREKKCMRRAA